MLDLFLIIIFEVESSEVHGFEGEGSYRIIILFIFIFYTQLIPFLYYCRFISNYTIINQKTLFALFITWISYCKKQDMGYYMWGSS